MLFSLRLPACLSDPSFLISSRQYVLPESFCLLLCSVCCGSSGSSFQRRIYGAATPITSRLGWSSIALEQCQGDIASIQFDFPFW